MLFIATSLPVPYLCYFIVFPWVPGLFMDTRLDSDAHMYLRLWLCMRGLRLLYCELYCLFLHTTHVLLEITSVHSLGGPQATHKQWINTLTTYRVRHQRAGYKL